jgi:hypothetical protein
MTNSHNRQLERQRGQRRNTLLAAVAAVAIIALAGFAITRTASGSSTTTNDAAVTGETNSMGMSVIATPGTAIGTATAKGITAEPATWALGQVPLDVAVRPNWTFTNTGNDTITLGEPHVQINQGCCPGALTYQGSSTLTPGATNALTFELSMHPGMDGAHDMTLHVPVTHADGTTDTLAVNVTGNFHN